MVDNSNTEKLTMPFFQENSYLSKFGQKEPRMVQKQGFFDFLKTFVMLVFLENNLDRGLILLLIFEQHIWQNFGS